MFKSISFVSLSILVACTSRVKSNPCANPGSTYDVRYKQLYGNCGELPTVKNKINEDGTIEGAPQCKRQEENGCNTRNSDCKLKGEGFDCLVDTNVTFTGDGSSATGLVVLTCDNFGGSPCSSSYSVFFTEN